MIENTERLLQLGKQIYQRDGMLPVIRRGTEEWDSWRRYRINNGLSVRFFDRCERFTVPTRFPPDNLDPLPSMRKSRLQLVD